MSLHTPLCPICDAESFGCEHEVLRWSNCAGEYVESPAAKAAERFEEVVFERLELAWSLNVPPKEYALRQIYRRGQQYLGPEWTRDDRQFEVRNEIWEYVLQTIESLDQVVAGEDTPDVVLFADEPGRFLDRIEYRIEEMELETEREAAYWGRSQK